MIFFLYGQDSFRAKEKREQIIEKYTKEVDPSGTSLIMVDASSINARDLSEKAGTSSLFAKKRLVAITNLSQNKKEDVLKEAFRLIARQQAAKEQDGDIFIFQDEISEENIKKLKASAKAVFQELAKEKYAQEFKLLQGRNLLDWISGRFQAHGMKAENKALKRLADGGAGDLWKLSTQINQIANYCRGKDEVKEEDAKEFLEKSFEADIFALTDAIGRKDRRAAIRLLEDQLQAGLAEEYILAMIAKHFENLAKVKIARSKGADPSRLGLHPFVMKKCLVQAEAFSTRQIKDALKKMADIERRSKSGTGQAKAELSLFIADL